MIVPSFVGIDTWPAPPGRRRDILPREFAKAFSVSFDTGAPAASMPRCPSGTATGCGVVAGGAGVNCPLASSDSPARPGIATPAPPAASSILLVTGSIPASAATRGPGRMTSAASSADIKTGRKTSIGSEIVAAGFMSGKSSLPRAGRTSRAVFSAFSVSFSRTAFRSTSASFSSMAFVKLRASFSRIMLARRRSSFAAAALDTKPSSNMLAAPGNRGPAAAGRGALYPRLPSIFSRRAISAGGMAVGGKTPSCGMRGPGLTTGVGATAAFAGLALRLSISSRNATCRGVKAASMPAAVARGARRASAAAAAASAAARVGPITPGIP